LQILEDHEDNNHQETHICGSGCISSIGRTAGVAGSLFLALVGPSFIFYFFLLMHSGNLFNLFEVKIMKRKFW